MKKAKQAWLVLRALYAIARYDVVLRLWGSGRILRQMRQQSTAAKHGSQNPERAICDAVLLASCLYWKPVLCLQRSVCTALLLRRDGVSAQVVIGFRPSPFFCHAWVEIEGRVAYGSTTYQKRLQPLYVA